MNTKVISGHSPPITAATDKKHLHCVKQAYMLAFTLFNHVFLCLPRTFEHGTSILVTYLIQDEDRTTCPYHLRHLERKAAVSSCVPSLAHNKSMDISSCGLTPQIHRIIDLSFRRSRCKSPAVGAQVSLPWRRAERNTHELWGICAWMSGLAGASWTFPRQYNRQESNRHQRSICHQDNRSWLQHQADFHLHLHLHPMWNWGSCFPLIVCSGSTRYCLTTVKYK